MLVKTNKIGVAVNLVIDFLLLIQFIFEPYYFRIYILS